MYIYHIITTYLKLEGMSLSHHEKRVPHGIIMVGSKELQKFEKKFVKGCISILFKCDCFISLNLIIEADTEGATCIVTA